MKNRLYIISLSAALLGSSSCQKLDRDFITTVSKKQLDVSYDNVQNEVTSIYSDLPDGTLYIENAMMASATDEAEHTQETATIQAFNNGSWNAINNPDQVWGKYYKSIRRANQLLTSLDKVNLDYYKLDPSTSQQQVYASRAAEIRRWGFETRFLRAYYYFELVKRYGGVPLLTKALKLNTDFSAIPRSSLNDCIRFIVAECDSASNELPPYSGLYVYDDSNLGRATKYAALALKSRVLLYAASDLFNNSNWAGGYTKPELISVSGADRTTRWKAAADAAKAAIDAIGVVPLGTYGSLFNTFNNPEIIFTRRNGASNTFEKVNNPIGFPQGSSGTTPSQNLVDAYEMKTTGKPISDPSSGYDAANPYANRDPRLDATVITNNSVFGNPARKVELWNGGLDGKPITFASNTGYYLRKYQIEGLNLNAGNTGVHSWIIFRVPELYLNYAEALNEYSPGHADSKKYVDLVRARTGVDMPPLPAGMSQTEMRERIRNERRVEFAFEDHRFWDVRRWMQAPTYFAAPLRGVTVTRNATGTFTYTPTTVENRAFDPKMYLYPIPLSEIQAAKGLLQNPLW